MRTKGKITHWNDSKGYGFITPSAGAKRVFVHITAFNNRSYRPQLNDIVSFSLSADRQGRPRAVAVAIDGKKQSGQKMQNGRLLFLVGAALFLALVCFSVLSGMTQPLLVLVYLAMSLFTFVAYAWDKSSAQRGAWRTSESSLHLLSLLGGWPGALIAQQVLRHKSRKKSFRFAFWITVVVNCGFLVWTFTEGGSAVVDTVISSMK